MSGELVVQHQRPHASLPDKIAYAKALASSNLLPRQYHGNPANLLFALEYAETLGVSPINAITSIHVIEGKPSASADLIAGLVRRAGHRLRVTGDDTQAVAEIVRADDPSFTFSVTWTMDRAKAAGLTGKGTWKAYPAAMLRSRAITEVARAAASDALFGVIYTPEELGAQVDADGDPVIEVHAEQQRETQPEQQPAEPVVMMTRDQSAKMHALFRDLGIEDHEQQVSGIARVIGRPIQSKTQLTTADARQVIDSLTVLAESRRTSAPTAAEQQPEQPARDDADYDFPAEGAQP